jgi:hypothetical protein
LELFRRLFGRSKPSEPAPYTPVPMSVWGRACLTLRKVDNRDEQDWPGEVVRPLQGGRWLMEMDPPILYDGLPPEDLKMVAVGPRYAGDALGIDPRTWPDVVNMFIPAPGQDFDGELALKDIVSVRLAPERGVTFVD